MDSVLLKAPEPQRRFLEKLKTKTEGDARLLGIAVSGSLSEGTADEFSDVDLQIVLHESALPAMNEIRKEFVQVTGSPLVAFTGEHVGEPRLTITLFKEDLLHVDFKFVSLEAFTNERVDNPAILWEVGTLLSERVRANPKTYPRVNAQWVEDRFWVWVHYVGTKN